MTQNIDFEFATPQQIEEVFGKRLEAARLAKNITQTVLANEAGVSRRTITRIEHGQGVSMDTFIRVARALGFSSHLADLIPKYQVRPVERVRNQGVERQRARTANRLSPSGWTWKEQDIE